MVLPSGASRAVIVRSGKRTVAVTDFAGVATRTSFGAFGSVASTRNRASPLGASARNVTLAFSGSVAIGRTRRYDFAHVAVGHKTRDEDGRRLAGAGHVGRGRAVRRHVWPRVRFLDESRWVVRQFADAGTEVGRFADAGAKVGHLRDIDRRHRLLG